MVRAKFKPEGHWQTAQQNNFDLLSVYHEYYFKAEPVWLAFEKSVKDYYKMLKDTGAFLSCNRILVMFGDGEWYSYGNNVVDSTLLP